VCLTQNSVRDRIRLSNGLRPGERALVCIFCTYYSYFVHSWFNVPQLRHGKHVKLFVRTGPSDACVNVCKQALVPCILYLSVSHAITVTSIYHMFPHPINLLRNTMVPHAPPLLIDFKKAITKPLRGAHNNVSATHHAQCCMQSEETPHWHRAHSTASQRRIN